ncbi:hypothetical protein C8R48DRAFT_781760 [Suillus tomentosus]|nr:hypothetical protein C8R48DRAFT_781760 [Suillus tomentosus]
MPDEIPHAQLKRRAFSARRIQCPYPGCKRWLKNSSGLKLHQSSAHSHSFTHPGSQRTQHASVEEIEDEEAPRRTNNELWESKHGLIRDYHETLTGRICDENGNFVDPGTPPPPYTAKSPDDWTPYRNQLEFECADFMYTENQMSAGDINKILYLWGITLAVHRDNPPFADYKDLYNTIDADPSVTFHVEPWLRMCQKALESWPASHWPEYAKSSWPEYVESVLTGVDIYILELL